MMKTCNFHHFVSKMLVTSIARFYWHWVTKQCWTYHFPLNENAWSFFNKLKSLYQRRLCVVKFGWKCPGGSGEVDENMKSLQRKRRRQQQRQRTSFDQKISLDQNKFTFTTQMVSTCNTVLPRYKKSAEYPLCTSFVISLCSFRIRNWIN